MKSTNTVEVATEVSDMLKRICQSNWTTVEVEMWGGGIRIVIDDTFYISCKVFKVNDRDQIVIGEKNLNQRKFSRHLKTEKFDENGIMNHLISIVTNYKNDRTEQEKQVTWNKETENFAKEISDMFILYNETYDMTAKIQERNPESVYIHFKMKATKEEAIEFLESHFSKRPIK